MREVGWALGQEPGNEWDWEPPQEQPEGLECLCVGQDSVIPVQAFLLLMVVQGLASRKEYREEIRHGHKHFIPIFKLGSVFLRDLKLYSF